MALKAVLSRELGNRMDCVEADFERPIEAGANREALERIVKHSMEIGIIKDKLMNIHIHDLLEGDDNDGQDVSCIDKNHKAEGSGSKTGQIPV